MENIQEDINKVIEFQKLGDFDSAEALLKSILELDSNNDKALNLEGKIQYAKGNFKVALDCFFKAVKIAPCASYYSDLGKLFIDLKSYFDAIEAYRNAIKFDIDNYDNWFYLAYSFQEAGKIDDAIMAYRMALSINQKSRSSYQNLGNIYYKYKNNPEYTADCYKKLTELEPENIDAQICLAVSLLKIKHYEEGWKYFESRLKKKMGFYLRNNMPDSPIKDKPLWNGENLEDKVLYIYYEGGFGDTIMFSRFILPLSKKCKKIIFRPQNECFQLFKDSFSGIDIVNVKSLGHFDLDYHLPLMSLPSRLGINSDEEIILKDKYLVSDNVKVERFKQKYFQNKKFKVGIKWQGDITFDENRKIDFDKFIKLLDIPNVEFFSLQIDAQENELDLLHKYNVADCCADIKDFSDTAAIVENLDLVISNDTSVAHLAGSLGKKCWVLLPYVQDWRWSMDLSSCHWYDSLSLFKQDESLSWDNLMTKIYNELVALING